MDAGLIVTQIVAFALALSFHEAAHAWTANRLGDSTAKDLGRITLNPVAHIDPFMTIVFPALLMLAGFPPFGAAKPVPVDTRNLDNPKRDHAWIAAAGPISNVILAAICILSLRLLLAEGGLAVMLPAALAAPLWGLLYWSLQINLILAAFNLIPIPPLDGSWIVSSLLSGPVETLYRSIQPYGFVILMVLIWSGALGVVLRPLLSFGDMLVLF